MTHKSTFFIIIPRTKNKFGDICLLSARPGRRISLQANNRVSAGSSLMTLLGQSSYKFHLKNDKQSNSAKNVKSIVSKTKLQNVIKVYINTRK